MKKLVLSLLGAATLATASNAMALDTRQLYMVSDRHRAALVPTFAGEVAFDFPTAGFSFLPAGPVLPGGPVGNLTLPGSCVYSAQWLSNNRPSAMGGQGRPGTPLTLSAQCFVAEQMVHGAGGCMRQRPDRGAHHRAGHHRPELEHRIRGPATGFNPFGQIDTVMDLRKLGEIGWPDRGVHRHRPVRQHADQSHRLRHPGSRLVRVAARPGRARGGGRRGRSPRRPPLSSLLHGSTDLAWLQASIRLLASRSRLLSWRAPPRGGPRPTHGGQDDATHDFEQGCSSALRARSSSSSRAHLGGRAPRPSSGSSARRVRPARRAGPRRGLRFGQGSYRNRSALPRAAGGAEAPAGKPSLQGIVYSGEGQALAGATVVASTFDPRRQRATSPVESDEDGRAGALRDPLDEGHLPAHRRPGRLRHHRGRRPERRHPEPRALQGRRHPRATCAAIHGQPHPALHRRPRLHGAGRRARAAACLVEGLRQPRRTARTGSTRSRSGRWWCAPSRTTGRPASPRPSRCAPASRATWT